MAPASRQVRAVLRLQEADHDHLARHGRVSISSRLLGDARISLKRILRSSMTVREPATVLGVCGNPRPVRARWRLSRRRCRQSPARGERRTMQVRLDLIELKDELFSFGAPRVAAGPRARHAGGRPGGRQPGLQSQLHGRAQGLLRPHRGGAAGRQVGHSADGRRLAAALPGARNPLCGRCWSSWERRARRPACMWSNPSWSSWTSSSWTTWKQSNDRSLTRF